MVGLRSQCKAEVHAVLAKCGIQISLTDLFGPTGLDLLDRLQGGQRLPTPYLARVRSLRRVIEDLDFEIDLFSGILRGRLARDPGYHAVQQIPGIGPVLGAVFMAEVGDVTRFQHAAQLDRFQQVAGALSDIADLAGGGVGPYVSVDDEGRVDTGG